ncbi:U-box-domain-containing protein [Suhomyces tanzawaensis NRRL Y-17324]|uniref:RING-type E3 ubiquitin transferase n=1 Tax=Suhomyces tanzawaensis NRRL Y-17324 TaxID=984487 RepID=A0A1E4SE64_9ASCO|nr:U-box-domain-containing protein [Suhomyces tanzawaensis NRRL Y-17324]ODV77795.1 U-box-domain-containing protein [Suhomyces tanzawaensis NRRL Y-17324]
MLYKESANTALADKEYSKAINYYTLAIKNEPTSSFLFSSRAKAYYMNTKDLPNASMQQWKKVTEDCQKALLLDKRNYDAMFYHALYILCALDDYERALKLMEEAYKKSLEHAKSLKKYLLPQEIYHQILRMKKAKREKEEEDRIVNSHPLFESVLELLEQKYNEELEDIHEKETDKSVIDYCVTKVSVKYVSDIKDLIKVFSSSYNYAKDTKRIDPPDNLCDPISFNLFHEPVVTPSGHTYEKAWLWHHLSLHDYDPLTRQKLSIDQCYPNLSLKVCVDEFVKEHGKNLNL